MFIFVVFDKEGAVSPDWQQNLIKKKKMEF